MKKKKNRGNFGTVCFSMPCPVAVRARFCYTQGGSAHPGVRPHRKGTNKMTPMKFTKSHEREEGRLLKRGFVHSCIGLTTCWLPLVGLLFSASGFIRIMVRLTRRHRRRRKKCLVFSFLVLALCTAMLLGEIWVYSRDPDILSRTANQVWTFIVGEENAGALSTPSGTEYDNMDSAGLGVMDSDALDDEFNWDEEWTEEDWASLEDEFDWSAWEDAEWDTENTQDAWDDWAFSENDLAWSDGDWYAEDWSDEDLWLEDESSQEDLSGLSEEEIAWLTGESDEWLGESSSSAGEDSLRIGTGEAIVAPTE